MTAPLPYGLSSAGFLKKRLPEIKTSLEDAYESTFGVPINRGPDSVVGQHIGIAAKGFADLWEAVEDAYHALYPNSAEGVALDNVCLLLGITRLPASPTTVIAAARGIEGTRIPAGAIASIPTSNTNFKAVKDVVITRSNSLKLTVKVTNVINNYIYTILLSNVVVAVSSPLAATKETIAQLLASQVDQEIPDVIAVNNGDGTLTISARNRETGFTVTLDDNLTAIDVWTPVKFQAVNTGKILALRNSLTRIDTPATGWEAIDNFVDGVTGRETETDEELRIRRLASTRVSGSATVESIKARLLQEVTGVSGVSIFENRTGQIDNEGRPPHSFETLVTGGADQEIASALWKYKPAGIETHGSKSAIIIDSQGDRQVIHFSRAKYIYVWLKVEISLYDEEAFPADGVEKVKEAVFEMTEDFGIGTDIILQRFFGPAYSAVPGIASLKIYVATSETGSGPPGPYVTTNLPINATEVADFDINRISAQVVA